MTRENKKVFITGHNGLVGRHLIKYFTDDAVTFDGDITKLDELSSFVSGIDYLDAVIHLAAMVPKQIVDDNIARACQVNVLGTINLLESLKLINTQNSIMPWIFYASTSHCYKDSTFKITEADQTEPFTFYGLSKLQGEQWIRAYSNSIGLPACVGRIFSFSHPEQPDLFFMPAMVKKIKTAPLGQRLTIPGVLGQRDFLRVDQICQMIHHLYTRRAQGIFNMGSGHGHVLADVIRLIASQLGRDDLEFDFVDENPKSLVADMSKIKNIGFKLEDELPLLIKEMALKDK